MAFRPVADLGQLRPGEGTVVALGDIRVALFHVDGEVTALDNTCPHAGGPLGLGDVDAGVVTCPFHGWQFDVRTGACRTVPGEGVVCYAVRLQGTTVYVDPEMTR
jgi:nitrite reductase/ring-hydroxylating ferredoxin subunit